MPNDAQLRTRKLGAVYYCAGANASSLRPAIDTQRAHVAQLADILEYGAFESLLYLSSTRVYLDADGGDEESPLRVRPTQRDQLFNITKLAGEAVCLGDARPAVRVARVSNVVGPGARAVNFLPSIIGAAISARHVILRSALASAKDYLSIGDCVRALVAISALGTERLYNVASGFNLAHEQFIAILSRLTDARIEVAPRAPTIVFPLVTVARLQRLVQGPPENVLELFAHLVRTYKETP